MNSRITSSMTARMLLADIQRDSSRLATTQQKMASGKEIVVPSDDPFATSRALDFRSEVAEYRQYTRNVGEATAWQDVTDTALSTMTDLTMRARELLVQGASDTVNQAGRNSIANEIDQIAAALKAEANTQYAGRYVFAGTQTTTQPYNQATDVYAGDSNAVVREIGRGVQVPISVAGINVVGDGASGLLGALRQIATDLRTPGSTAALGGADLQALDVALDAIVDARGNVGALTNRLDVAKSRLGQLEETTSKLLSETEDADMAKTLIDYSMQQSVYQAALKAGAQLIQPSLLDFLR